MVDLSVIPEFVELLSSHLDISTLASCAQVSHTWYTLFIPHVWHTFGALPSRPVRFGIAHPPTQFCYQPPAMPLVVPTKRQITEQGSSSAASPHTSLFAFAKSELYPESGGYQSDSWSAEKRSMWKRLFTRSQVTAEELEQMRLVVAKHGHLVRCLVVRSVQAFRVTSPYCTNLRAFHCRFEPFEWQYTWRWYLDMTMDDAKQVNHDITLFVQHQQHQLESLHLMAGLMDAHHIHEMIKATSLHRSSQRSRSGARHWKYLDAPLGEADYRQVVTLLPMAETARFSVRDGTAISTPLPVAHHGLRELDLQIPVFTHHTLQAVLASFPNLGRLFVRGEDSGAGLDLAMDQRVSMLYVGASINPDEVARIIPLVPNLMVFDYHELTRSCVAALAQSCPRLRYVSTDRWVHRRDENDPENQPPSVSPLLTSCPDLVRVNCPTAAIHMRDLVGHHHHHHREEEEEEEEEEEGSVTETAVVMVPWVCRRLKYLNCQLVGVPALDPAERELCQSWMTRWPEMMNQLVVQSQSPLESNEAWMLAGCETDTLRKLELRARCWRALEEQLRRVPDATTWIDGFGALW